MTDIISTDNATTNLKRCYADLSVWAGAGLAPNNSFKPKLLLGSAYFRR
jgi:hypothetical protein